MSLVRTKLILRYISNSWNHVYLNQQLQRTNREDFRTKQGARTQRTLNCQSLPTSRRESRTRPSRWRIGLSPEQRRKRINPQRTRLLWTLPSPLKGWSRGWYRCGEDPGKIRRDWNPRIRLRDRRNNGSGFPRRDWKEDANDNPAQDRLMEAIQLAGMKVSAVTLQRLTNSFNLDKEKPEVVERVGDSHHATSYPRFQG